MADPSMDEALEAVGRAEAMSRLLPDPTPRRFDVHGSEAVAGDRPGLDGWLDRIPRDPAAGGAGGDRGDTASTTTVATTGAAMVRLSKFSNPTVVRARAFYPNHQPPLSMKLVIAEPPSQGPVLADVAARTALGRSRHLPAPRLLESGADDSLAYLVEPIVFGTHPSDRPRKMRTARLLLRRLLAAQRAAGVEDRPLEVNTDTPDRLAQLAEAVPWRGRWPARTELLDRAVDLLHADLTVPWGWCHGDVVFSNIILDERDRPRLVDWEFAGRGPLAGDPAKLIAATHRPMVIARFLEGLATPADIGPRPGRHPLRHQLAVSYLRELSWWEPKLDRSRATGRTKHFELWAARRFDLVARLLADPDPPLTPRAAPPHPP